MTSGSATELKKAGGFVESRWTRCATGLKQATSETLPPRGEELFRTCKLEVLQAGSASWRFRKLEVLQVGSASWFCKLKVLLTWQDGRMGLRQDGFQQDGPPAEWAFGGEVPKRHLASFQGLLQVSF